MTPASFASAGVRRNVLARSAAGGPGFGPKAFNVKSARTSCAGTLRGPVERPNPQNDWQLGPALNNDWLESQRVETGRGHQLIYGFFQENPRFGVADEKTPVLDLDIVVENGLGRRVYVGNKPRLVECDRGQAHRVESGDWRRGRSARSRRRDLD